ncbi:MAG: metallophosphoesterase family protein [Planctomycetota bacterium]
MPDRWVIGDVHGCSKALRGLIEEIAPAPSDEVIFLGDYIDRGPDSRDCIDQLIALRERTQVRLLRGNHELMLSAVLFGGLDDKVWLENGGRATVTSYGGSLDRIPDSHRQFFATLLPHYETECEIFVHANYEADVDMNLLVDSVRYWKHLAFPTPLPHQSGKRVFVGHTPQPNFQVLDLAHLICVDTCCFGGGYLSALHLHDGNVVQFDVHGHRRRGGLIQRLAEMLHRRKTSK